MRKLYRKIVLKIIICNKFIIKMQGVRPLMTSTWLICRMKHLQIIFMCELDVFCEINNG